MAPPPIQEKKRKKPSKTKKTKNEEEEESETLTLENLKTLGHQLLSSRSHINNLPVLLSVISSSSPLHLSLEALISLQSFFVPLVPDIPSKSSVGTDPELVYRDWLRKRFDEFVKLLIEIAVDSTSEDALKDVALDAIMDFVKLGKNGKFNSAIYHRLLCTIVHSGSLDGLSSELLANKYFNYIDVCFFTFTSLDKIAKDCDSRYMTDTKQEDLHSNGELSESRIEISVRKIYNILSRVPLDSLDKDSSQDLWSQLGISSKEETVSSNVKAKDTKPQKSKDMHNEVSPVARIAMKIKLKFTKAWLSFLRLPLPLEIYKEVLVSLHQNVIPYMENPAILCDFLTKSYDIGGVISVMALSGLFVLMTQHGLEYPKFYEKLYALLTPAVFMAKHRAVFFQLLDSCLKSSHLPAYLAAAFAKKMSRLCLSVPPSGELVIVAIIHNLLRRHPSINFLVQKQIDEEVDTDVPDGGNDTSEYVKTSNAETVLQSKKHGLDPFKCDENDPAKCDAMRSSLWEIDTLRHHYCPAVSRLIASLENDLTVRAKTSELSVADFSSASYATIFGDEIRRRIKQVPLAFFKATPNSLFWESDFPGWSFEGVRNHSQDTGNEENAVKSIQKDDNERVKRRRVQIA